MFPFQQAAIGRAFIGAVGPTGSQERDKPPAGRSEAEQNQPPNMGGKSHNLAATAEPDWIRR